MPAPILNHDLNLPFPTNTIKLHEIYPWKTISIVSIKNLIWRSHLGPNGYIKPVLGLRTSTDNKLGVGIAGKLWLPYFSVSPSVSGNVSARIRDHYWLIESFSQIILLSPICQHFSFQKLPRTEKSSSMVASRLMNAHLSSILVHVRLSKGLWRKRC